MEQDAGAAGAAPEPEPGKPASGQGRCGHVEGVLPALDRRDGHPGELPGGGGGRVVGPLEQEASRGPRVPARSPTRPAHPLGGRPSPALVLKGLNHKV